MLGRTIGKYRVVEKIGRGGMGTVYKAIDETLDREVAIKALNRDLGENEVVRRFRAEAMTLARLNHPGIATIYELLRAEDELLMVMEFVRGETFDRIVERVGPLAPARAASLVAQVLDALGHAHRVGIVHRDLKPANLMLTQYGAIKIMDFGIARVLGTEHLTSDGLMMGTPAYMAPEQVLATDIDARADLYSIGVVLYRLLSGSLPFQADTAIAMAHKQVKDPPTPLRQHRAELPDWCEPVLARALAKSPADRFQTAEDFRDSLVSLGASLVPATARTESLEITLAPDQVVASAVATAAPVPRDATLAPPVPSSTPVSAVREPSGPVAPARVETPPLSRVEAAAPSTKSSDGSTTVILQKRHIALAAGLFAVLVVVFGVLAALLVRQPAPTSGASADAPAPASEPAAASSPAPAATAAPQPASEPPAALPEAPAAAAAKPAAARPSPSPRDPAKAAAAAANGPSASPASGPAKEPAALDAEPSPASPAPAAARDAALPPLTVTDVRIVVADDGRLRERDAVMTFSSGNLTVADRNGVVVHSVPYSGILGVSYSRSRQPLWLSPGGPAPVLKIGGGAFGIFRSEPNWYSVRTKDVFLVLRVEPKHLRTLPAAFSDRAGVTVEVVRPR
jgi:eukaryotic-like serine/threonine-protein kinase